MPYNRLSGVLPALVRESGINYFFKKILKLFSAGIYFFFVVTETSYNFHFHLLSVCNQFTVAIIDVPAATGITGV